ncbi:hypothetical protein Amsp01_088690 [Amycolatopsis sp. NBRC 101858]|uniref:hypothetical protein n=1 Tax=Amycolatopsis sp. NBRC 101858 TaxID=3032200 RepID=UPI0024A3E7D4|nr:hypothetical protein [Amycolatopsis sp. NBRC 101858]GLY42846.1 hypothetical protein Amsp01_088690 [Amycolatopsis sp. NBRC 101858]
MPTPRSRPGTARAAVTLRTLLVARRHDIDTEPVGCGLVPAALARRWHGHR